MTSQATDRDGSVRVRRPRPSSRRGAFDLTTVLAVLVAAGAALPLAFLLVRARDVGWRRAVEIATSDRAVELLVDTSLLAVAVTASCLLIAIPLAWVTVRTDLPGRRTWTVLSALPLAIPSYVGGYTFVSALGPKGLVQGWLEPLGVERLPEIYGFRGAWLVLTLFSYPYVLLPVRAALRRLDPTIEEASRTLGRGRASTFVRVVLPQLRPAIASGALLVALYTLSDFGAVSLLRFDSFTRVIFVQQRASFDLSVASIYGLMLVVLTIAVLGVEQWTRGKEQYHRLHGGGARTPRTVHLGRWRWVAAGLCALLVLVALVLPLAVIVYWLQRGISAGEPLRLTADLVRGSVRASALGALGAVAAAWPVAALSVRRPGRLARLVERLSWSGYALPGIVVALSLVYFGARYVPSLYQTMWMLVFAYVVLFLPQAVGAIRSSMLQVTPSLEEASRLLGAGPFRTLRRVSIPLVRPGLTAGAALVFLTCMKELPATLLLAPTGYSTLATQVYNATVEAFFARAAAPALALVLLSALPMALLVLRESERGGAVVVPAQADEAATEVGESIVRGTSPAVARPNATVAPGPGDTLT